MSGIKYYVLFLDQFSHFLWFAKKTNILSIFPHFLVYIQIQLRYEIKVLRYDNRGWMWQPKLLELFFSQNDISFHFSYPCTSRQAKWEIRMYDPNNKQCHPHNSFLSKPSTNIFVGNPPCEILIAQSHTIYVKSKTKFHLLNL